MEIIAAILFTLAAIIMLMFFLSLMSGEGKGFDKASRTMSKFLDANTHAKAEVAKFYERQHTDIQQQNQLMLNAIVGAFSDMTKAIGLMSLRQQAQQPTYWELPPEQNKGLPMGKFTPNVEPPLTPPTPLKERGKNEVFNGVNEDFNPKFNPSFTPKTEAINGVNAQNEPPKPPLYAMPLSENDWVVKDSIWELVKRKGLDDEIEAQETGFIFRKNSQVFTLPYGRNIDLLGTNIYTMKCENARCQKHIITLESTTKTCCASCKTQASNQRNQKTS